MPNNVLLCGCGWLNSQLVDPLQTSNTQVLATTRNNEKLAQLTAKGVQSALFDLGQPFPFESLVVKNETTIILSIPPGRRNPDTTVFESGMRMLLAQFAARRPAHLIFISTTAVYGEKSNDTINERSELAPQTASAHAHVALEHAIAQSFSGSYTVLRLAGLVGPNRHPVTTLAGKQLSAPNRVVNLIHSEDVVSALLRLIQKGPQNKALHLAALAHPQRRAYYTECAKRLRLTPPTFISSDNEEVDQGKKIDANVTLESLGITLAYPSPYDMVPLAD